MKEIGKVKKENDKIKMKTMMLEKRTEEDNDGEWSGKEREEDERREGCWDAGKQEGQGKGEKGESNEAERGEEEKRREVKGGGEREKGEHPSITLTNHMHRRGKGGGANPSG